MIVTDNDHWLLRIYDGALADKPEAEFTEGDLYRLEQIRQHVAERQRRFHTVVHRFLSVNRVYGEQSPSVQQVRRQARREFGDDWERLVERNLSRPAAIGDQAMTSVREGDQVGPPGRLRRRRGAGTAGSDSGFTKLMHSL